MLALLSCTYPSLSDQLLDRQEVRIPAPVLVYAQDEVLLLSEVDEGLRFSRGWAHGLLDEYCLVSGG